MKGKTVISAIVLSMFLGGFGLIGVDYYFEEISFPFHYIGIFVLVGMLGLILTIKVAKEVSRNWYWHELHMIHGIGILILILIVVIGLWYYGLLDWFL